MTVGTAYYDFARNPPSFNFLEFLLQAELWRKSAQLDRIAVVLLPGPLEGFRNDVYPPSGGRERSRWRDNIVVPMPVLLPSCAAPAIMGTADHQADSPQFGRGEEMFGLHRLVQMAKANNYPLSVPQEYIELARAKHGERYVTLTERKVDWQSNRTPNLAEWAIVARVLEDAGYKFILIPEGSKASRPADGFSVDQEAGRNSLVRAGVYAAAAMNFGIPCGPMWFAWFIGAPMIMCRMLIDGECTKANDYSEAGLEPGKQLANARPRQLLLWDEESAPKILAAFERIMA